MEFPNITAEKRFGTNINGKYKAVGYLVAKKFTDHLLYGNELSPEDSDLLLEFVDEKSTDPRTGNSLNPRTCTGDSLAITGTCSVTGELTDVCELVVVREKRKGYKLEVSTDSDAESPREWDNVGTLAWKHGRLRIGREDDEEITGDVIEWLEEKLGLEEAGEYSMQRLAELEGLFFDRFVGHKVYIYEHGNVAVRTSPFNCRWDSGQLGYIYCERSKVLEEYGDGPMAENNALKYMNGEIEALNQYLSGEVYSFILYEVDEDGEEDVVDSCSGFYDFASIGENLPEEARHLLEELGGNTGTEEDIFEDIE